MSRQRPFANRAARRDHLVEMLFVAVTAYLIGRMKP